MSFEHNVFINCPFDEEYRLLLKPLVFTLTYFGFEPKLSQTFSSSSIRINQIVELIRNSKFSIHDLSRSKAMKKGELPRFNMPYELGIDIGSTKFGNKKLRSKRILILETEKYHYQKVLSDIAGQDIYDHNDDPFTLITRVRDWFSLNFENETIAGQREIWNAYNQFIDDLNRQLKSNYSKEEINSMPIGDFVKFGKDWIDKFQS